MSSPTAQVLVTSKSNNRETYLVSVQTIRLPTLSPFTVRVRTHTIGLTSNNLSYARGGAVLGWWSAYPVPSDLEAPYNDSSKHGIVPAWGYGEVLESNIDEIKPERFLHGFWPMSTYPVDLKLHRPEGTLEGHWIEKAEGRTGLMNLYNRYTVSSLDLGKKASPENLKQSGIIASVAGLYETAYLLNHFVFPADETVNPIHPLGAPLPWTKSHADLTRAVLVIIAASRKTARAFSHQFSIDRPRGAGPVAMLEISSLVLNHKFRAPFERKSVTYDDMNSTETLDWLKTQRANKYLIVDFGGRDKACNRFIDAIWESGVTKPEQTLTINLGGEAKIYTPQDQAAHQAAMEEYKKVQSNMSGERDVAMKKLGEKTYFKGVDIAWMEATAEDSGYSLTVKENIGLEAIQEDWRKMCDGTMPETEICWTYRV